jgi:hypothetical protein
MIILPKKRLKLKMICPNFFVATMRNAKKGVQGADSDVKMWANNLLSNVYFSVK